MLDLPEVTLRPPFRISSLPPSAGLANEGEECAGVLARVAESSGGPSSLVRNADASCAFAPRRVANSETAREAVKRSAAETTRRRRALVLDAAPRSAFAERR